MSFVEDLADDLARDTLAAGLEIGDERLYEDVSKAIAVLSPTLQEAFMTSIRIRLAEQRGRHALELRVKKARAKSGPSGA